MKKLIPAIALLAVFIGLSFQYINVPMKTMKSEYRSAGLERVVTKDGNVTRTDYIDKDGNPHIAADTGYATKLVVQQDHRATETYLDDRGERISMYFGQYGIMREYDDTGNIVRITYLDENNNPMIVSTGYATEERDYNESGQQVSCRYLDTEGKPARSYYDGYGVLFEYDDKGHRVRITHIDETGAPMLLPAGYSSIVQEYYEADGPGNEKVKNEYYFLPDGTPASLALGQYGIYMEYDKNGQISLTTYLDTDGSPMVTNKGYTSIRYTYYADNSVQSAQYYDINGNPFRMSEGQYGTKSINGQTVYLNADGTEQFNIKRFVYNYSGIVVIIAMMLVILSAFTEGKMNRLMLIIYFGVIVYFTLMYRETGGKKIFVLRSYSRFFSNAEMRASIIKNIWLFVPLGAVLFRLCPRKIILFVPVLISVIIETVQYFTGTGLCELDDVISNGLGSAIGYGLGCLMQTIRRQFCQRKDIPNIQG